MHSVMLNLIAWLQTAALLLAMCAAIYLIAQIKTGIQNEGH